MSQGLMGIHDFRWYVLYLVTVHPYRGIFVYSPFLLLSFVATANALLRGAGRDRFLVLIWLPARICAQKRVAGMC